MAKPKKSETILSKYFLEMSMKNKKIPYMTKISKDTGVSPSTISRYSTSKGYYNFGELRGAYNRTLSKDNLNENKIIFGDYEKYNDIVIVTSNSTKVIGQFLLDRLQYTSKNISILDNNSTITWSDKTLTIFISLSGESRRIRKYYDSVIGDSITLSTVPFKKKTKATKQIVLSEFKPPLVNVYEIQNSIIKIMAWINLTINSIQIREENKNA